MSTTEQRLREALAARTDAVHPDPDAWDRLQQAVDPSPRLQSGPRLRRRPLLTLAVAAWTAVVLFGAGAILRENDRREDTAYPGGGPAGEAPSEFVAIVTGGDIVRVDAATGRVRGLVTPSAGNRPGTPPRELLDITPDHQTVYFSTAGPGCGGGVFQVPADGGTPTLVAPAASDPAVSPDGRLLAFLEGQDEINCSLVVVNLASGERRTFSHPNPAKPSSGPGTPSSYPYQCSVLPPRPKARPFLGDISYFSGVSSLSWSRDSQHIAILAFEASASPLRPPEFIPRAYVLDTAAPGGLENMRLVGPLGDAVSTTVWTSVQWQDGRSLLVLGSDRCGPTKRFRQLTDTVTAELELVLVDTITRTAKTVTTFERDDDAPYRLDAASSGHVLWISEERTVATLRQGRVVTLAESTAAHKFSSAAW
jgi:hypothetical protein